MEHHATAALTWFEEPTVPFGYEAGSAPEPFWASCEARKSCLCRE